MNLSGVTHPHIGIADLKKIAVGFLPLCEWMKNEQGKITPTSIEIKKNGSLVSYIDRHASTKIRAHLGQLTPALEMVDEEVEESHRRMVVDGFRDCWVVDPLDDTKGYLQGRKTYYSISIGLMKDGRPYGGIVFFPASEKAYLCYVGCVSENNIFYLATDSTEPIWAPLCQARRSPSRVITISLSSDPKTLARNQIWMDMLLLKHPPQNDGKTPTGFGAVEVLCDLSDVFICTSRAGIWDILAVTALLRARGGIVAHLSGKLPDWTKAATNASCDPLIFATSLAAYRWVRDLLEQKRLSPAQLAEIIVENRPSHSLKS